MANKFSWDTIESDYSAGEKSSLAANALRASGMFNELTNVGTNFFDKRGVTAKANAESESASNTADIIEQIRSGKTPERTGFYDAGAIGNAKYAYDKDQIALGFRQRAEGRAIAAANRARGGATSKSKLTTDAIAKIMGGSTPAAVSGTDPDRPAIPLAGPIKTSAIGDTQRESTLQSTIDGMKSGALQDEAVYKTAMTEGIIPADAGQKAMAIATGSPTLVDKKLSQMSPGFQNRYGEMFNLDKPMIENPQSSTDMLINSTMTKRDLYGNTKVKSPDGAIRDMMIKDPMIDSQFDPSKMPKEEQQALLSKAIEGRINRTVSDPILAGADAKDVANLFTPQNQPLDNPGAFMMSGGNQGVASNPHTTGKKGSLLNAVISKSDKLDEKRDKEYFNTPMYKLDATEADYKRGENQLNKLRQLRINALATGDKVGSMAANEAIKIQLAKQKDLAARAKKEYKAVEKFQKNKEESAGTLATNFRVAVDEAILNTKSKKEATDLLTKTYKSALAAAKTPKQKKSIITERNALQSVIKRKYPKGKEYDTTTSNSKPIDVNKLSSHSYFKDLDKADRNKVIGMANKLKSQGLTFSLDQLAEAARLEEENSSFGSGYFDSDDSFWGQDSKTGVDYSLGTTDADFAKAMAPYIKEAGGSGNIRESIKKTKRRTAQQNRNEKIKGN